MDFETLHKQLLEDFNLQDLPKEEQDEMLFEVAKTIQKQFLLDVYDILGKEKFSALEASVDMGDEFYNTTLKHLIPNYEEVFQKSRMKVVSAFKGEE
jgi:hypothetical protein